MAYAAPHELNRERRQWIVLESCGCVVTVMEGTEAATKHEALLELYPDIEELERWFYGMNRSLISVPHAEYEKRYLRQMKPGYRCPHEEKKRGFWRRLLYAFAGDW